jgi:NAD-dependent SIR2 family protein deacetylase
LQCHGSFAYATCLHCKRRVQGKEIELEIMKGQVPVCRVCTPPPKHKKRGKKRRKVRWDSAEEDETDDELKFPPGIMKVGMISKHAASTFISVLNAAPLTIQPDITFFGEKLTDEFDHALLADREAVDLLLVIGTSLNVAPVSDILCKWPFLLISDLEL